MMGDRRIAQIVTSQGELYFYTHIRGKELPMHGQIALDMAVTRWDHEEYALKIVLDQLIRLSESRDKEDNAGIVFNADTLEDEYSEPFSVIIDLTTWKVTQFTEGMDYFEEVNDG
tara:strand:- start:161 stop:505 length:345 start_codon:yes stop_codon:yes gene_type:complete